MFSSLFATLSFCALNASAAPMAASAEDCPAPRKWIDHRVKSRDSLHRIARRYQSRVIDIVLANPSVEGRDLVRGELLRVCKAPRKARKHLRLRRAASNSAHNHFTGNPSALNSSSQGAPAKQSYFAPTHKECGHRTPLFRHRVIPGEVLSQIAARYGVSSSSLLHLNPRLRNNPNLLQVGQELAVCPDVLPRDREKIVHVVKPGQSLSQIAAQYNLSPKELIAFQEKPLTNPNFLQVGQELDIWRDGEISTDFLPRPQRDAKRRRSRLRNPVNLVSGTHYTTKHRRLSWGTARSVALIQSSIRRYKDRYPHGPKVHVGDLSLRRGGHFPPHVSHRTGHDVDIGYVLKGEQAHVPRFITAHRGNLDRAGTWALLRAFLDTDQVQYIFMDYPLQRLLYRYAVSQGVSESELEKLFQYPRRSGKPGAIIRHSRGHDDHIHIRFWPKGERPQKKIRRRQRQGQRPRQHQH